MANIAGRTQVVATLQNLESSMLTSAVILEKFGRADKAEELRGARGMVLDWIEHIAEMDPDDEQFKQPMRGMNDGSGFC